MKAKDLAALAALGVAGYAAYDKFGKKDEAKPRGKLGDSKSAVDDSSGEYRGDMLGKGRSANEGDAGEAEARNAMSFRSDKGMRPDAEMQDTFRAEGVRPDVAMPVSNAIGAQGREVLGRELRQPGQNWGGEGRRSSAAPAAKAASSAVEQPATSDTKAPRQFTPPGNQSSMGALSRATKPSGSATSAPSSASGNAAMAAFSQAKAVPRNIQYATEAEKARQARIDEQNYDSDLMKNRRQAVVDTVKNIPANVVNAFTPPEKTFQNKTYVKDGKVVRYAKGGMVKKMSSGGMSSSKPKPSTASSRGDGIAQRGKTRGQLR
jgi:hypothetical protein